MSCCNSFAIIAGARGVVGTIAGCFAWADDSPLDIFIGRLGALGAGLLAGAVSLVFSLVFFLCSFLLRNWGFLSGRVFLQ